MTTKPEQGVTPLDRDIAVAREEAAAKPEQGATEQGATDQGVAEQGVTEPGATNQGAINQGATPFDPVAYINTPRWRDSVYGLHRIEALLERLGRPQDKLRFVHVAGTNGKGSTCAYIASIMRAAGYHVGMFTSPYLFVFEERIQVDGVNISLADLTEVTLLVREAAEALFEETGDHATEFELMTAVSLLHFARQACDIVVLEVGLGGTLDSTNVIESPEVCVITRIGLDHTDLLGSTLEEIATQKAGIIKPGASVVKQRDEASVMAVCEEAAKRNKCPFTVVFAEDEGMRDGMRVFAFGGEEYRTKLLGRYQSQNAATALAAIEALRERGWAISSEAAHRGVEDATWPARFEVVATDPTFVVDGGHNPQGALALVDTIRDVFPGRKVVFLMSVLADKDYPTMVRTVLSLAQSFVVFTPPNPRALSGDELALEIQSACCAACSNVHDGTPITQCSAVPTRAVESVAQGVRIARILAGKDGIVVAFGSLYSVDPIMEVLRVEEG